MVEHLRDVRFLMKVITLLCSCNSDTVALLKSLNDILKIFDIIEVKEIIRFAHKLPFSMSTNADRTYFSQVLILLEN